ncbi:Acetylornithine/succinyldiaminopimelate/putrescine aminotransferase [Desulfotomaculum arcticum]|uniref:Acetylornithine/succinyldiaminopimelate/putrescine aminotransferase n=2 Tax=Desulfotruncus TaxID=2867377 RepID=A0A1I2UPB8_9FIRM|nr:Acetylornithine/succinyldiaminopimelate/putrescine aminotransferase [Desulfotomaculum arcticum] [Desulfotruncus arcticus DSM 17038]
MKIFDEAKKDQVFKDSLTYWNSGKTQEWLDLGIDLVMGKREGYYFYDLEGQQLMDVHINGGTYSLGHRNKEVIDALIEGTAQCDMGNHHFPSVVKAALAKTVIEASPQGMTHVIYGSSGGEAVDLSLKCARNATGRKKIISVQNCYHGHTGLAVAAGSDRFAKIFLADTTAEFNVKVPFNDIEAMEQALSKNDAACVIMETIPATYGFPLPKEGYLPAVKALCEKYGALYIADEVQTGLMRSGEMWAITGYGVIPDMIVTSKGFSGGIYPISAVIMNDRAAQWMRQDGSAHMSTFGGSELGCICALKVFEILNRPSTRENVKFVSQYLRNGLEQIKADNPHFFTGIRQNSLIMGLEFAGAGSAVLVMQHLYKNGVWAIYSMLDNRVLQFKPGLLCTKEYCDELLGKMAKGIKEAAAACGK